MKLYFSKKDTIHKIFKTLEKIPSWRSISIEIDPNHWVFNNIWLWKQINDLLLQKNLDYVFLCYSKNEAKYFQKIWAKYELKKNWKLNNALVFLKDTFVSSTNFHKQIWKQKSSLWYFIIWLEVLLVLYVFYFLYMFVTPSADIYIKPSYQIQDITYNFRYVPYEDIERYSHIEQMIVPFHTKEKKLSHSTSMTVENIRYEQKPSHGEVVIYNETNNQYSLVSNTRLVTIDWLVFRTKNWIKIPPATQDWPWTVSVEVKADTEDQQGEIIWDRWNISKWTRLYIRNLSQSYNARNVYAKPVEDFKWGDTDSSWVVEQSDIDSVEEHLTNYIEKNLYGFANSIVEQDQEILLHFSNFFDYEIKEIQTKQNLWDESSTIDGDISFYLKFSYIRRDDFKDAIWEYIEDRTSENYELVDIDKNSLIFYQATSASWYYVIPTTVNTIRWYDFEKDKNSLKNEILSLIAGEDIATARDIILDYDEADVSIIRVNPPWYDVIPPVRSRINIVIDK